MEQIAAVVLAAGKGTRMKSDKAKVLHRVCGRPIAYYPIRAALSQGSSPVVVVVGHQAEAVEKELSPLFSGARIEFALQAEQLGTGHAVMSAEAALRKAGFGDRGSVLILAGDVPLLPVHTLQGLVDQHHESAAAATMLTALLDDARGYGRIVRNAKGGIERIVEEKDATPEERRIDEVNASIYLCDAGFLFSALSRMGRSNAQGEYYLTDIVAAASALAREGRVPWPASVEASEDEVSGINDRAQLATSAAKLQERRLTELMKDGVTVIDPSVTWLEEGVEVGADSILEPMVSLRGKTKLGKGSKANHLSYLGDAVIGEGCNIGAGTITCNYDGANKFVTTIEDGAFVGSDTQLVAPLTVGKGAYVGTGTTVREDVPAGSLAVSAGKQRNIEGWVEKKAPKKSSKKTG